MSELSRRQWLSTSAGLAVSAGLFSHAGPFSKASLGQESDSKTTTDSAPNSEISVFTKSFQSWPIEKVCEKFAELGVAGLDLTVRSKGHILPHEILEKLPAAHKTAQQHGQKIVQITSEVTAPDEYAKTLFETAGKLGIRHIKLGYYRTSGFGNLSSQVKEVRQKLRELTKLAKSTGVLPCVHIHSGTFLPSHGTMLYLLIQDFDPAEIGAYVDTLHMSLEGGSAGWKDGLDLLAPWIQMCAVKNYALVNKTRDQHGQQRYGWKTAPLADGISPLPEFFKCLKQINYSGPYSLHSEYLPELNVEECYAQTAADLKYFRKLISSDA